jgi:hypothetical protein
MTAGSSCRALAHRGRPLPPRLSGRAEPPSAPAPPRHLPPPPPTLPPNFTPAFLGGGLSSTATNARQRSGAKACPSARAAPADAGKVLPRLQSVVIRPPPSTSLPLRSAPPSARRCPLGGVRAAQLRLPVRPRLRPGSSALPPREAPPLRLGSGNPSASSCLRQARRSPGPTAACAARPLTLLQLFRHAWARLSNRRKKVGPS